MSPLSTEQFAAWWKQTGAHELAQLLLWRWDPLGVADLFPAAADEYDGYAPQIVQLLRGGASPEAVAEHLAGVEREALGLTPGPAGHRDDLARRLARWFEVSQAAWLERGPGGR